MLLSYIKKYPLSDVIGNAYFVLSSVAALAEPASLFSSTHDEYSSFNGCNAPAATSLDN